MMIMIRLGRLVRRSRRLLLTLALSFADFLDSSQFEAAQFSFHRKLASPRDEERRRLDLPLEAGSLALAKPRGATRYKWLNNKFASPSSGHAG
jgi:hypothetical protein